MHSVGRRCAVVLLALWFVTACAGDRRTAAIQQLADLIESDFVYPEIGKRYATELRRKLAANAYADLSTEAEVAAAVTADLQRVHREGHLKLMAPDAAQESTSPAHRDQAHGVSKSEWLAPGVAYMRLHGFTGNEKERDRLREVLDSFSNAATLIIDARQYHGGTPMEGDVMFSYFFEQPARLLWMDVRREVDERGGNPMTDGPTLERITGPDGIVRRAWIAVPSERSTALRTAQIFVLTSKETSSAGEGFALALKRTRRATLIGETTAGAGHFGRTVPLPGGYRAFIPVGRPFDPDTGKGWEQTGVDADIAVRADRALDEALRRVIVR
jgi:hypothetical protein